MANLKKKRKAMTKIYVVTSGHYSDYGIESIFSTKKNAEAYTDMPRTAYAEEPEIEIWELDSNIQNIRTGKSVWRITLTPEGKYVEAQIQDPNTGTRNLPTKDFHGNLSWYVWAKDRKGAIKAGHDKWSGWKISQVATEKENG